MSKILKGNFTTKKGIKYQQPEETVEIRFEQEALKKLGGSIAFVSKQKVVWGDENADSKKDEE